MAKMRAGNVFIMNVIIISWLDVVQSVRDQANTLHLLCPSAVDWNEQSCISEEGFFPQEVFLPSYEWTTHDRVQASSPITPVLFPRVLEGSTKTPVGLSGKAEL